MVPSERRGSGLGVGRGRSSHGIHPGIDPLGPIDLQVHEELIPRDGDAAARGRQGLLH